MKPTHEQQIVIDCHHGKIMVQACAGSGKTTTMANRTMALNENHSKLVLAFNKKASQEFESKLKNVKNTKVMTFHSFCLRELQRNWNSYGFKEEVTIWQKGTFDLIKLCCGIKAKSWEQAGIDKDLYEYCGYTYYTHELKDIIESISSKYTNEEYSELARFVVFLNDRQDPRLDEYTEKLRVERQSRIEMRTYRAVLAVREFMSNRGVVDFSAMIRMVAENRHNLINKFDHIMVDEFQDVDRFQFDIIKTMGKSQDVISFAVVGDCNQMIYGWRGALNSAFGAFKSTFLDHVEFSLTVNFRSTKEIVSFAEDISMSEMKSFVGESGINVVCKSDIDFLSDFIKDDKQYSNYAILHRFNKDVEMSKRILQNLDIPSFVIGGSSDFWKSQHVNLALRYLERNWNSERLFSSEEWAKIVCKKKYRESESALNEIKSDVEFVLGLELSEVNRIKECHQNEKGVQLSTIHKTKGLEWDSVLVIGVDNVLINDTCLYYVACTRPRKKLVLDIK